MRRENGGVALTGDAARSPSASAADGSWTHVQSAHAAAFSHSAARLTLPFREYRRPGSWRVPDLTDHTAALMRNAGEHQQLWLMDLSNGRTRQVFARATDARPGFWIGSVHLSDGWLAWEEVGPGDDLAESVDWKLYAAPLERASLAAGKPHARRLRVQRGGDTPGVRRLRLAPRMGQHGVGEGRDCRLAHSSPCATSPPGGAWSPTVREAYWIR